MLGKRVFHSKKLHSTVCGYQSQTWWIVVIYFICSLNVSLANVRCSISIPSAIDFALLYSTLWTFIHYCFVSHLPGILLKGLLELSWPNLDLVTSLKDFISVRYLEVSLWYNVLPICSSDATFPSALMTRISAHLVHLVHLVQLVRVANLNFEWRQRFFL